MGIVTQAHREHFDEYGYMVIENAVPTELCNAAESLGTWSVSGGSARVGSEKLWPRGTDTFGTETLGR